jgi:hypothetical protein
MFDILEADIVVFQETKIQRKDLRDDMVLVPGWDCYFSLPKHKKGRSIGPREKVMWCSQILRLLWCRYLYSKFNLRPDQSGRGHNRHPDTSEYLHKFPRPARR